MLYRCPCEPFSPAKNFVRRNFVYHVLDNIKYLHQQKSFEKLQIVFVEPGGLLDEWHFIKLLLMELIIPHKINLQIVFIEPLGDLPHIVRAHTSFARILHKKYFLTCKLYSHIRDLPKIDFPRVIFHLDGISQDLLPSTDSIKLQNQLHSITTTCSHLQWHALWYAEMDTPRLCYGKLSGTQSRMDVEFFNGTQIPLNKISKEQCLFW